MGDELLYAFILIVLGVVIVFINALLANQFYEVAKMKGYKDQKYFFIPFFFTFAGYILVAALPSKTISVSESKKPSNELPDL